MLGCPDWNRSSHGKVSLHKDFFQKILGHALVVSQITAAGIIEKPKHLQSTKNETTTPTSMARRWTPTSEMLNVSNQPIQVAPYLEDHPMSFSKQLATMVIVSP